MHTFLAVGLAAIFWATPGLSEVGHSPYAGLETREIAALSESDIAELESGGGWGLALPAELNGYPGPKHVLELSEALELSTDQEARLTEILDQMRADAIEAGAEFIAAEMALDRAFSRGGITQELLGDAVVAAGDARDALRLVHLSRHLMTIDILSDEQVRRYNVLRGYAEDPCAVVPQGHDVEMWRRHNGCTN